MPSRQSRAFLSTPASSKRCTISRWPDKMHEGMKMKKKMIMMLMTKMVKKMKM